MSNLLDGGCAGTDDQNGVFLANEWTLTAKAGYGSLGLIGQSDVYPAYYAYQMYQKFGSELIYSSSDDPHLSIYAARRPDGTLTIMIINLSLAEKKKALQMSSQTEDWAEIWLFDPTHRVENMEMVKLSSQISFPPQSITLLIVP